MSNTSLRKIQVPALNHANFGKAIMEQFANIDANFQKLSNFELNAGIPGKSCLYVTINLAAPFVYPTSDINDPDVNTTDYNAWVEWIKYDGTIKTALSDTWQQMKDSVASDYEQFKKLTGLSEYEYTQIAAKMLWGSSITFTGSTEPPSAKSLTGSLHAKYEAVEGPIECTASDGTKETYYGNWLFEIFKMNTPAVMEKRAEFFIKHARISTLGRIIVAISPLDDNVGYYPVGSLEYWYIDPRFRNAAIDRDDTSVHDISCVMHWTPDGKIDDISWPGHFEILEIFPTIRRGEDGKYYWFINGLNTGVPVQGPAGKDGTPAQLVICQRVENVLGYDPEKWPNGELAIGPQVGTWTVPMSAFAGDSPRNLPSRVQYVNDMPAIVPQFLDGAEWPGWPKNLVPKNTNKYSRVTDFSLSVDKSTAWLREDEKGYVLNEPENLFRIYRIVGREILWKGPESSNIDDKNDPVNHRYDPSCDRYYFGADNVSEPDDLASIQQLIELLDGATAIVLPGPAYQYDRTDSTYWFTTLRKVEWHKPGTDMKTPTGRYMLMAYCSDEERIHNALDEHTQAGMMQRLDPYAYKSNGDNRNKPRGLMLPIGSAYAAYTDGNFDWAWASHIMHSDCGGFTGFRNGRGIQQVNIKNQRQTVASDTMHNATGRAIAAPEAQYTEVIGKRILHVGSVNDYRALNYVDNNTTENWNGGVPGREEPTQNLPSKIGTADFYGKTVSGGWFEGSELHVDEPMTITRYRDLHKRQRLLDVEGDVVIGPRMHKNGPDIIYRNRDGGLIVHSTISPDTGKDTDIFPAAYDPTMSIFNLDWYGGLELTHRAFYRTLEDAGKQPWQTVFGRWKYGENRYRAFYDVDGNAISTAGPIPRENHKHMFSFLGDDGIGARVMVAQDGFVVYNPAKIADDDGKVKSVFSVDAMGNIQTMGDEVRSNADDTLWVFHSRWTGPQNSYANLQGPGAAIDWNWLNTDGGDIKNMIFTIPEHNKLMIGTDHEVQFVNKDHSSIRRLERSWRATNFYPWKDAENTELCIVPMGWLFNFGPLDDTGFHMRTFMSDKQGQFGQTWGSNELMPVTAVLSPDINHFYGVLHVNGIDCMAVRSKAKENEQNQTQYLSGRYGSQIAHGLIVGPALGNIGNDMDVPRNLDIQDFENDSLYMQYRSISWWENDTSDSAEWGQGADASPMFAGETSTPIAIWGRGSIFAEKTLIADEDLVVNRAATIRAQIRAKSFRRHYNSFDKGSKWAFLLDDGYSSRNAIPVPLVAGTGYREIHKDNAISISADNSVTSPIIYDLGEAYGPQRFVKFGYLNNVRTNENQKYRVEGLDNEDDREIMLFGFQPSESKSALPSEKPMYLFKNGNSTNAAYKVHRMNVTGIYNGLIAIVQVKVNMDARFKSRDSHHGGWFHIGSKHRTQAYGFCWQGQNYTPDCHDQDASGEGCVCDGFSWDDVGLKGFPKPISDSYVYVNSLFHGDNSHNWNVGGTDSARDRVYGIWFKLTPQGTLEIASAHCPGAMNRYPQTITLTFAYPAFPDSLITRSFKVCYTEENAIPANDSLGDGVYGGGQGTPIVDLMTLPDEWKEASEDKPYLWIKTMSGFSNASTQLKWEQLPWTLWKSMPEKTYIAYYVVTNLPNNDNEDEFGAWEDNYPTPILQNSWILGSLGAQSKSNPKGKDTILLQTLPNINKSNINPAYLLAGEPDDEATTSDYDGDDSDEAKQAVDWIGGKSQLIKMLLAEGEYANDYKNAQYIVKVTTRRNIYTNPHTNRYRPTAIGAQKPINDGATWEVYLTKEEAYQQNQGGGFFGQSTKSLGLVGHNDNSYWDKSWSIPEKFLRLPGGEWADNSTFNDVYGDTPKVNMYSVNVETAGQMVIVDLKVALDTRYRASGDFVGSGIGIHSDNEIVNQATTAYLPAGAPLPDGPVYVSFAALKAWKGGRKKNKTFNTGESVGKSFANDNPTHGIVMKLTGEVLNVSGIQDPDQTGRFIIERGAHIDCMVSPAQYGPNQFGGVPCPIAAFRFIYKDSGKKMQADKYGNSPYIPSEPGTPGGGGNPGGSTPEPDMSSDNWLWTETDCTATNIKTWLNKTETSAIKSAIIDALDADLGTIVNASSNYGQVTIEKTATNKVQVSMIVTAYKESSTDLSHRSINFTYDTSDNVTLIGTYIIGEGNSETNITEGLTTNVFGGTYKTLTGFTIFTNGFLNHCLAGQTPNTEDCGVLEQIFTQAATKGADVRKIGGETVGHWQNYQFANGNISIGWQNTTTMRGRGSFNYWDGSKLATVTGSWEISGTFSGSSPIKVTKFNITADATTGGGGSSSTDITNLQTQITNLQTELNNLSAKIVQLSATPDVITVNVPAGQSVTEVTIAETDMNGNDVNPVDTLNIKTESGLTHNG